MKVIKIFMSRPDRGLEEMFNKHDCYDVTDSFDDADIVVFGGGLDINPSLYGEEPLFLTRYDDTIDKIDIANWKRAVAADKPMIGVCRGAQFLNVMNGGKLWQDVKGHTGSHDMIDLAIDHGSKLQVTSTHHQMMIADKTGVVLGIAHEGTSYIGGVSRDKPIFDTEIVWYDLTRSLCCQFHPEYNLEQCRLHFFDLVDDLIL